MKKILLTLIAALTLSTNALAQEQEGATININQYCADLLQSGRVFELKDLIGAYNDVIDPTLSTWAGAVLATHFGKNDEAADSLRSLINNYADALPPHPIFSAAYDLATSLATDGRHEDAAEVYNLSLTILKSIEDAPENMLARIPSDIEYQRQMTQMPRMTFEPKEDGWQIPFVIDSIGRENDKGISINVAGKLNGTLTNIVVDTGAAISIISKEKAEELGLKPLGLSVNLKAGKNVETNHTIIETMEIGNMTLHNVLFNIVDIRTGNEEADKHIEKLSVILGMDVLSQLGGLSFAFEQNSIIIPPKNDSLTEKEGTTGQDKKGYLAGKNNMRRSPNNRNYYVQASHDGEEIDMLIDTGFTHWGNLSYEYFLSHKDAIIASGESCKERSAGIGGAYEIEKYRLHDFPIVIDGKTLILKEITVTAAPTPPGSNIEENIIGLMSLQQAGSMTMDFEDSGLTLGE